MPAPEGDQFPKPLPKFKKVLRPPSQVISGDKCQSTLIRDHTEDLRPKSQEPASKAISVAGKYSSTANGVDDTAMDAQLRLFSSNATRKTEALHTRLPHSKPKFVQVVPSARKKKTDDGQDEFLEYLDQDFEGSSEELNSKEAEGPLEIEGLIPKLLPHQQEGVRFLSRRENSEKLPRGALLADAMGLGKTIQSIALMLLNKPGNSEPVKTTLIVVPLAVLDQWKAEINNMAPSLKVMTHQGLKRTKKYKKLLDHDAVITTYDTVRSEHSKCDVAPLYQPCWWRIIADEAHNFRNPESRVWMALTELKSNGRKIALTGTPVHNSPVDLYALFYFLGVPRYLKVKNFTKHDFLTEIPPRVDIQIKKELSIYMMRRSQRVIDAILPPLKRTARAVKLSTREMFVYAKVAQGGMAHIVYLREACNGMTQSEARLFSSIAGEGKWDNDSKASRGLPGSTGADQLEIDNDVDLSEMLSKLNLDKESKNAKFPFDTNTKVRTIREILLENRQRKTVIFSCFRGMLHMLSLMLRHEGIGEQLYFGQMNSVERDEALARFRDPKKNVTVLLCSIQTAAVGLNLTTASQVIIADPWYNPQIVDQAVMRVHRLGQREPVTCIELYAEGVIEERLMALQAKKREMAKNLLDVDLKLTKKESDWLSHEDSKKMKAIIARYKNSVKPPESKLDEESSKQAEISVNIE